MLLFFALDIPASQGRTGRRRGAPDGELAAHARIVVAVICAMVAYALMNLVMTSTPLAVVGCGFTKDNAPTSCRPTCWRCLRLSFFTGHLITRFGVDGSLRVGLDLLALPGGGLQGVDAGQLLRCADPSGVGWNFGFIGATTMLAGAHAPHERGRVQGMNDMIVFRLRDAGVAVVGRVDELLGGDACRAGTRSTTRWCRFWRLQAERFGGWHGGWSDGRSVFDLCLKLQFEAGAIPPGIKPERRRASACLPPGQALLLGSATHISQS